MPRPMDDAATRPADAGQGEASQFPNSRHASWFGELDAPTEAAAMAAQRKSRHTSLPDRDNGHPTFQRIYRAFLAARLVLGMLGLLLLATLWSTGSRVSPWAALLGAVYATLATLAWFWPGRSRKGRDATRLGTRQALGTVGVDLTVFALIHHLSGNGLNAQALLVMPVLMSAVLLPRVVALGVAAAATLNLLSVAWVQGERSDEVAALMTQGGLNGLGLFLIAALASELAARLAREERSARGNMEAARRQAQLNKLVIDEMTEGVLVVDRRGRVRTANPSARRLLSAQGSAPQPPFPLTGVPAWRALIEAIEEAMANPGHAEVGQEVTLHFDDRSLRELRLRMRFIRGRGARAHEDVCVLFIEDLRSVRARQRQDKLAAMGRMSAGIAHEVRNPLAAIAQANALMAEDAATSTQQRLTQMVADNVARLKHIVDDILAVAPGVRPPAPAIDPLEHIVAICNEWRSTAGVGMGEHSLLEIDIQACRQAPNFPHLKVRFEPEHLQRVLVNLLDNALRHQSGEPGAIRVHVGWVPTAHGPHGLLMISVLSDGPPITADTERALFEPFFSTRSRGTGLGLYICRELCERHGATIDYRQHQASVRHRNEFYMTMPIEPASLPATQA